MKKMLNLFSSIILISLTLISCSKDNNDEIVTSITGTTWGLSYLKFGYPEAISEYTTKTQLVNKGEYDELEFNSNGRVYQTGGKGNYDHAQYGIWNQQGNTLTIITTSEDEIEFTLNSNKLIYSKTYSDGFIEEFYYTKL
jgi:hypothetical protein